MRALKSLIGMATLALTASLVGCGGGGDAGAPRTPLGTLVISGSPLEGEALQDKTRTDGVSGESEIRFQAPVSSNGIMVITFDETTGTVTSVSLSEPSLTAAYACAAASATPCSSVSVSTTARTITFNGTTLKTSGGESLTLRGDLDLTLPDA